MKIASRYRPFSHKPGVASFIPGTDCVVRAYPTALFIKDQQGHEVEIEWAINGLVEDFTVMQDLEKQRVLIYGRAEEGYFSYALYARDHNLILTLERASMGSLKGTIQPLHTEVVLKPKEHMVLFVLRAEALQQSLERISLGNHKSQEWERMRQRKDPLEYFPFWFAAGQLALDQEMELEGTLSYVKQCEQSLQQGKGELLFKQLQELFKVGFEELMLPRLYDTDRLGLLRMPSHVAEKRRPLRILKDGYRLIRAMLLQEQGQNVQILPHLPPLFHAGRGLNLRLRSATCNIEWSKKLLKKLIITSFEPQTLHFSFQKSLKSFRLRDSRQVKGTKVSCGASINLGKGIYILDQFQK